MARRKFAMPPLRETLDEERYTLETHRLRPVGWMETLDWLGDNVWFAHAIHVNDDEIRRLSDTGSGAAHCPCSNMRLASGIAPVKKYMDAGVAVGIGVDGSASNDASNMLLEVRQAMLWLGSGWACLRRRDRGRCSRPRIGFAPTSG
jgi:cytosine/adenosine deaminase-related metal-dependent hydrolase